MDYKYSNAEKGRLWKGYSKWLSLLISLPWSNVWSVYFLLEQELPSFSGYLSTPKEDNPIIFGPRKIQQK